MFHMYYCSIISCARARAHARTHTHTHMHTHTHTHTRFSNLTAGQQALPLTLNYLPLKTNVGNAVQPLFLSWNWSNSSLRSCPEVSPCIWQDIKIHDLKHSSFSHFVLNSFVYTMCELEKHSVSAKNEFLKDESLSKTDAVLLLLVHVCYEELNLMVWS